MSLVDCSVLTSTFATVSQYSTPPTLTLLSLLAASATSAQAVTSCLQAFSTEVTIGIFQCQLIYFGNKLKVDVVIRGVFIYCSLGLLECRSSLGISPMLVTLDLVFIVCCDALVISSSH